MQQIYVHLWFHKFIYALTEHVLWSKQDTDTSYQDLSETTKHNM